MKKASWYFEKTIEQLHLVIKQQIHRKKYSPNPETLVREETYISEAELQRSTVFIVTMKARQKAGNPHGSNQIPYICTEHRLQ